MYWIAVAHSKPPQLCRQASSSRWMLATRVATPHRRTGVICVSSTQACPSQAATCSGYKAGDSRAALHLHLAPFEQQHQLYLLLLLQSMAFPKLLPLLRAALQFVAHHVLILSICPVRPVLDVFGAPDMSGHMVWLVSEALSVSLALQGKSAMLSVTACV